MAQFANPIVAILFGAFMLCAETCLRADTFLQETLQPLDLPLYDWTAGGFLLATGILTRRHCSLARRQYQAAAWAFMLSLLTGALISHLTDWLTPPIEPPSWGISETAFLVIITTLAGIALCGLVATLSTAGSTD